MSTNENDPDWIDPRFKAQLPSELKLERLAEDEPIFIMESDVQSDSQFGPSFLVVFDDEIVGLEAGKKPVKVRIDHVADVRNDELFSGGRLVIKTKDDDYIEFIQYSRNLVPEFAAAARIIEDQTKGREVVYPYLEGPATSEGGIPLPERGEQSPLDISRWKILRRMWEFMRPYKVAIIGMMILITISTTAQLSIPLLSKYVVDNVLQQGDFAEIAQDAGTVLNKLILLILLAFVINLFTRIVANTIKVWISGKLTADLRTALHEKMQKLTMGYHNRKESGQLIGRVMNDTSDLQQFFVDGIPYLFVNLISSVCIGFILFYLHPTLALCVFLPVPLLLGGGAWFWKKLIPLFHKRGNRNNILHSVLGESINGVKAVKALGQEDRRHKVFDSNNTSLFKINYKVDSTFVRFFEIMFLFMGIGQAAVWYFGGHSILDPDSDFTFGDLVAFIGFMAMFYGPLQWFTAVINWMTHAFAASERILHVLDQPTEDYDDVNGIDLPEVKGDVSFEGVRFSYNRGKEIIKGISFDIKAGEMIGLVGKSGAGKSTIINLVCRFYDVDSGSLKIDGHDIRDIKITDWRKHIGIVMQDPFIFSGTITENIAYGNPEADFDDVMRSARAAKAHDFILEKEEGYDTVIGEGGVDLSGGERQRLAIARAILNDPPILVLDEATSAVDSQTEKAVQSAIATLVKGRTTIAIAHRLATLRNADRLIVIDNGEIAEQGSHEELMALKDGHFANLVKLQAENNRLRGEQVAYKE